MPLHPDVKRAVEALDRVLSTDGLKVLVSRATAAASTDREAMEELQDALRRLTARVSACGRGVNHVLEHMPFEEEEEGGDAPA